MILAILARDGKLRLFHPQLSPGAAVAAGVPGRTSFYVGLRAGLARPVRHHVFGPVTAEPENASVGTFDQLYGAALGATLGRHLGIEIPFEGYEMKLVLPGFGALGEYALYAIVPQARYRHPVLDERLWLHVLGGAGLSYGEFNDPEPGTSRIGFVHGEDEYGVAGVLGSGLEWFIATNICLTGEVRYLFARGHSLRIGDAVRRCSRLVAAHDRSARLPVRVGMSRPRWRQPSGSVTRRP